MQRQTNDNNDYIISVHFKLKDMSSIRKWTIIIALSLNSYLQDNFDDDDDSHVCFYDHSFVRIQWILPKETYQANSMQTLVKK